MRHHLQRRLRCSTLLPAMLSLSAMLALSGMVPANSRVSRFARTAPVPGAASGSTTVPWPEPTPIPRIKNGLLPVIALPADLIPTPYRAWLMDVSDRWLDRILSKECQNGKNNTDLSPQSLVTRGALSENLKIGPKIPSDKSDKPHLSLLSPKNEELLHQNLNEGGGVTSDRSDKLHLSLLSPKNEELLYRNLNEGGGVTSDRGDKTHVSGLSGENLEPQNQNLQSILKILTDKPDTWIQSIIDAFEERAAIVEYDGGKTALEAQCTAYREVLIKVLSTYAGNNTRTERR